MFQPVAKSLAPMGDGRVTLFGVALLLTCALALAGPASAQNQAPIDLAAPESSDTPPEVQSLPGMGTTVAEIRVSGNRRIEADAVKAVVSTKVGEKVSEK